MVGKSAQDVFHDVAELGRRDLIQQRSIWRAVLPHAIANRLAATALQNIPLAAIEAHLVNGAPARLKSSFSRRLGYLHKSVEAVRIAEHWLSLDGLLGEVAALSDLGRAMFANVAPVAMEATLGALERGVNGPTEKEVISNRKAFVRLVRSIAYDPKLFDRSVALLVTFSVAEEGDDRRNGTVRVFTSLFQLYLSGTCASIEQRLRTIEILLQSDDAKRQGLGVKALSAVLEAWHFMS